LYQSGVARRSGFQPRFLVFFQVFPLLAFSVMYPSETPQERLTVSEGYMTENATTLWWIGDGGLVRVPPKCECRHWPSSWLTVAWTTVVSDVWWCRRRVRPVRVRSVCRRNPWGAGIVPACCEPRSSVHRRPVRERRPRRAGRVP